jgi:DNA-binding transcriptional LysR family regulator
VNWDDIRLFLVLARSGRLGSQSRATAQDPNDHPRRITRIERALQTTLFEKTLGGFVLTQDGRALLERAERIEREASSHLAGCRRGRDAPSPVLSGERGGRLWKSCAGAAARRLYRCSPCGDRRSRRIDRILNPSRREADLAVMLSRPKAGPLLVRKLTDYRLALYAHPSFVSAAAPITSLRLCSVGLWWATYRI